MNINQALLISFVTNLSDKILSEYDISRLEGYVKAANATSTAAELENLMAAMKDSRKIDAIKAYRCMTGSSLLDAKNAVERYYVSQPVEKAQ